MESRLPIVILAGSDMQRGFVPPGAENLHFMVGYKGADVPGWGGGLSRSWCSSASGRAMPSATSTSRGPRASTRGSSTARSWTRTATSGRTSRLRSSTSSSATGPRAASPSSRGDVLPEAGEIAELGRLLAAPRDSGVPPALAISLIAADQDLGSSSWKPKYFFRPRAGLDLEPFLPGHLGIAWPSRLRTGLLLRLLHLAYRHRNRGYSSRKRTIVLSILGTLIRRDLWNLARLEPPTLTYSVLRHGLGTFARWRRGEIDLAGLELGLAKIVVRRRHFRREGPESVRIATSRHISFAKDLDTREELAELDRRVSEPLP